MWQRIVAAHSDSIERDIGAIDLLVNNTGIQIRNAFTDFPLANVQASMDTNVTSTSANPRVHRVAP